MMATTTTSIDHQVMLAKMERAQERMAIEALRSVYLYRGVTLLVLLVMILLFAPILLPPLEPPPKALLVIPMAIMGILLMLAFIPEASFNNVAV
ncbi:hypothetical protein LIER_23871 [Lithospermum erythrorhizon]|uniref:Uncharacterized protein n=1 Tax=Lithospermum erythrorhizon TaxID=34254 RepID=A0AAV3R257_LITER